MGTTNFYIALYDRETDTISLPYFRDEEDHFPTFPAGKTLTAYVIRTGKPLLGTQDVLRELEKAGEAEMIGAPSEVWMGAPLRVAGEVIGAVVVQSYTDPCCYTEEDLDVLTFVSDQIAIAIHRKQAAEELQHLKDFNEGIVQNILEGIVVQDRDGYFTFVNPAAAAMLGYGAPEDLVGEHWTKVVPRDQQPIVLAADERRARGESDRYELQVVRKDGTRMSILLSGSPRFEDGHFAGTLATFTDITTLKRLEVQLRQAQKMEAVGTLAGGIAHDFNNLLTAILGNAALLLDSLPPNDPNREDVKEIKKAGERAAALTRQILTFSRHQVVEPKVLDLNEVVADTSRMLQRVIGADIELTLRLGENVGHVRADPTQITQILVNLAANARDAMPEGGYLSVETAHVFLDDHFAYTHPGVAPGDYALLAVTDTGLGMTEEVRERIFEPFYTTKDVGQGTGLGLSVVYGIVRQYGGHISVYSEPDVGTRFEIYLPSVDEPTDDTDDSGDFPPAGDETILLAEDEAMVRALAVRILTEHGYTVLEARDGQEALALCQEHDGPIHLLLSDVIMPQMRGQELAERVKAIYPDIRVLYMSGYSSDIINTIEPSTTEPIMHKPFSVKTLLRTVRKVLET